PAGGIRFFSTIARDISERKSYEKRITHLANYDALSGLPNRSLLSDRTAQAMTHARRVGRPCALIVLDLDRFKLLNDSYGRSAGDALLRQVGERIADRGRAAGAGTALSASGGYRERPDPRRRSPHALAPRRARLDPARAVHPGRRRVPPDRAAGRLGAGRRLPPAGRLGPRRPLRSAGGDQCVGGPVPQRGIRWGRHPGLARSGARSA